MSLFVSLFVFVTGGYLCPSFFQGPREEDLPTITLEEYQRRAKEGQELVQIDGYVISVLEFKGKHPGGDKILKAYYGKDASHAFNGGLNYHTSAATNASKMMRIAKLEDKKSQ